MTVSGHGPRAIPLSLVLFGRAYFWVSCSPGMVVLRYEQFAFLIETQHGHMVVVF